MRLLATGLPVQSLGGPGSGRGQLVPGQYILVTSELLPGKSSWSTEKVLFLISTHPRTLGCLHFYVLPPSRQFMQLVQGVGEPC